MTILDLQRQTKYKVHLYPSTAVEEATYLGIIPSQRLHVFLSPKQKHDSEKVLLLNDHWITKENGVITYFSTSSEPVNWLNVQDVARQDRNSELVKLLEGVKAA